MIQEVSAYRCESCGLIPEEAVDPDLHVYSCGRCGQTFAADSNRCPDCHIYASWEGDGPACPECQEAGLTPTTAYHPEGSPRDLHGTEEGAAIWIQETPMREKKAAEAKARSGAHFAAYEAERKAERDILISIAPATLALLALWPEGAERPFWEERLRKAAADVDSEVSDRAFRDMGSTITLDLALFLRWMHNIHSVAGPCLP